MRLLSPLLLAALVACSSTPSNEVHRHVQIEPQGTFSNVDFTSTEANGVVFRIIEAGQTERSYQVILQSYARQLPSQLTVVDAAWENSAKTR